MRESPRAHESRVIERSTARRGFSARVRARRCAWHGLAMYGRRRLPRPERGDPRGPNAGDRRGHDVSASTGAFGGSSRTSSDGPISCRRSAAPPARRLDPRPARPGRIRSRIRSAKATRRRARVPDAPPTPRGASTSIRALVAVGGDGSLCISPTHDRADVSRIIGVPKTIDNDLAGAGSDLRIRHGARRLHPQAIDRLHTTAEAHERMMVVEVMVPGRRRAPDRPRRAAPMHPPPPERRIASSQSREGAPAAACAGGHFSIVVAAEGARPAGEGPRDCRKRRRSAAASRGSAARGSELAFPPETKPRIGGARDRARAPPARRRAVAVRLPPPTRFGAHAMALVERGAWGRLCALRGDEIVDVALTEDATRARNVDLTGECARTARALGICLGE